MIRKNISGRSMVEMLAILAIIGILTTLGIGLYTQALNSNKARQTLQEIARRSFLVPTQDEKYYTREASHEFLFVGLPDGGRKGQFYPLYTKGSDKTDYSYRIIVGDDSKRLSANVCKEIIELQGQIKFAAIFVNDIQYTANDDVCSSNGNQMTFYFDKGFGKNASGSGY